MKKIYYSKSYSIAKREGSRKGIFIFSILFILTTIPLAVFRASVSQQQVLAESSFSPESIEPSPSISILPSYTPTPPPEPAVTQQLGEVINNTLAEMQGNYGIVVNDLKNGENYSLQGNAVFQTASLYKLWVMATTYEQIKNRQLNMETILSQDISTLNKEFGIASESAERKEGNITLSVRGALEKMITVSDNYAAMLLSRKIKMKSITAFLKTNGLMQSSVGTTEKAPMSTPNDIAIFFKKLYDNELVSPEYSQEMLSLLKRQRLNSKIPKLLPKNTTIAHKTGELDKYTHDAGIVYTDKGDYIIVLMSKSDNPASAAANLATASKSIFDYFQNQQSDLQ